eukprot:TRINITY_DN4031_c1_g2_i3.p1 TRINITY_DN4031_c1_g2~~TRINITY_DN4031_c1_g2_i3.p1  ORF type:complete len:481 (-),score=50.58 TRINITY_DN4031_c1_g2_i3:33-1475(-)
MLLLKGFLQIDAFLQNQTFKNSNKILCRFQSVYGQAPRKFPRYRNSPLSHKLNELDKEQEEDQGEQGVRGQRKSKFPPTIDPLRLYRESKKKRHKDGGVITQEQRNLQMTSLIQECKTLKDLRTLLGNRGQQTLDGIHISTILLQTQKLSVNQVNVGGGHVPFIMDQTLFRMMPKMLAKMDANNLSLCASLLTELNQQSADMGKSVMAAIFRELRERVLFLDARGLRRTICAMQRAHYQDEDLMQQLINQACRKMKRFPTLDVGQMLYRLAQGGKYSEKLFSGCLTQVASKMKSSHFDYHYIEMAFGSSLSRHYDELFLRRTIHILLNNESSGELNFKNVNDLLSVAGRFNFNNPLLNQFLAEKLNFFARGNSVGGLEEVYGEGLISCIRFWSYLGEHPKKIDQFVKLLAQRWNQGDELIVKHNRLDFIYKAHIYSQFCHNEGLDLPESLLSRAQQLQDEYLANFRHSKPDSDRAFLRRK